MKRQFKDYTKFENIKVKGVQIFNCINPNDPIKKRKFNAICKCGKNRTVRQYDIVHRKRLQCKECGWKQIGRKKLKPGSGVNILWWVYKKGARKRGIPFYLTKIQVKAISSKPCYYCGSLPKSIATNSNIKNKKNRHIHNGIDRKNSNVGYFLNNCVPCCKQCNIAKWDFTIKEFLSYIKRIFYFQESKNVRL